MPSAAAVAVRMLAAAGSRRFYTVPGESYLELLDEIERDGRLRLISTRHESGAAFMAEADARMSGVPGVALASRAPGAANLAIGVHTAHYDSTPMVVLLGQVGSRVLGRGAMQEIDLTAFYAPITKWAATAGSPEDVPGMVAEGIKIATSGRPGPVAIAVPTDFWGAEVSGTPPAASVTGADGGRWGRRPAPDPDLAEIARRLTAARRPVAVAGGGSIGARAAVVAFAERYGIGVYTAFRRQEAFPCDHPNHLGHLGLATPDDILAPLEEADLLVVIGARLDEVTSQGFRHPKPGRPAIHLGHDASRAIGHAARELAAVLADLVEHAGAPGDPRARDWSAAHRVAERLAEPPHVTGTAGGVHPAQVVVAFQRGLPAGTIVANDAGNFAAFLHRHWRFTGTAAQLGPATGGMGYGVPAAIGAKLAAPDRTALAVVGDGGVLMTGQEIETAARLGIKIIVLVFQNGLYGTIAMHQARRFGRTAGTGIDMVDIAAWARGLGATALQVTDAAELDGAVTAALDAPGPVVVTVRTDPDVISPTTTLSALTAAHPRDERPSGT